MDMVLHSILVLGLTSGAFLLLVGARQVAGRLLLFSITLAIFLPFIAAAFDQVQVSLHNWGTPLGTVIIVAFVMAIFIGRGRFRQRKNWLDRQHISKPTSLKRRVSRD